MKSLAKTRTILHHIVIEDEIEQDGQLFVREIEDEADDYRLFELTIPTAMWDDMGKPDVITVSVEPGDKLN